MTWNIRPTCDLMSSNNLCWVRLIYKPLSAGRVNKTTYLHRCKTIPNWPVICVAIEGIKMYYRIINVLMGVIATYFAEFLAYLQEGLTVRGWSTFCCNTSCAQKSFSVHRQMFWTKIGIFFLFHSHRFKKTKKNTNVFCMQTSVRTIATLWL